MTHKKTLLNLLLTLLLGGGLLVVVQAQELWPQGTPDSRSPLDTAFTYQGYLEKDGNSVNGQCDFQFGLWDASTPGSGNQIGPTLSKTDVTVDNGYFTVTGLDFGTNAFTGEARWLEIAVRCAGEGDYTTLGRAALKATPYALYALSAPWSGLSGVPGGFADGTDDDTTYTASTGLDLTAGQFSLAGSYRLPQTCNNGQIAEWNDAASQWECGNGNGGNGDITGVYAGDGLTGGGASGELTLTVTFSGAGSSAYAARSDHNHDDRYYTQAQLQDDGAAEVHWNNLSNVPSGLNDGDDDTLDGLTCGSNQVAKWNGSAWACAADADSGGDITAVYAGTGLTDGGVSGELTVTLRTSYRLPQSCSGGQMAEWNGTSWVCSSASYWSLTGNAGTTPGANFLGATDEVSLTLAVGGRGALRLEPDAVSPNIIGGYSGNSVDAGAIGALIGGGGAGGSVNRATGNYDVVGGGYRNQAGDDDGNPATGQYATVGGGIDNTASGGRSTVSGGDNNTASGNRSVVPGGRDNLAAGNYSFAAGRRAQANHDGAFVWADSTDADFASTTANQFAVRATGGISLTVDTNGGGLRITPNAYSPNTVGGHSANFFLDGVHGVTIGGGGTSTGPNRVTDSYSTIGGGRNNQAGDGSSGLRNALCATVAGGDENVAWGYWSFVGGGNENWAGRVAAIAGGNQNVVSATTGFIGAGWGNVITGTNMWYDNIVGGYGNLITGTAKWSHIGGGDRNTIQGNNRSFIGGGRQNVITGANGAIAIVGGEGNTASGDRSFIGGGDSNTASGDRSFIGGGDSNTASGGRSTIGGGYSNEAGGSYAPTIAGGYNNAAGGDSATVGGGRGNTASGLRATVPGGYQNTAGGNYSFAAGRRAQANSPGCFVWGDSYDGDVTCSNNDRAIFRSSGGFYIYTNSGLSSGSYLAANGSSWNSVSNRALKENFAPVDAQTLLENLAAIPISTWNYKTQNSAIRHIGPMAQDFNALLPDLGGEGEKYINSLDADGVALAAIQGLYEQNREQAARIEALETENAALKAENEARQTRLDNLEARLGALEAHTSSKILLWPGLLMGGLGLVWIARRRDGGAL